MTLALSVLDLSPVPDGVTAGQALQNTLDLARRAEALGYGRYWLAEHHNMPGLASAAPEVLIGQVAGATSRIRVGSGGIMLPNHAPLHVAEAFLTLEALFPGRIDLGLGRAAGTDARTALALRRGAAGGDDMAAQVSDLLAFAGGGFPEGHPFRSVSAMPANVPLPPVWLLGSSDYSARLAGRRGLGFAFAHHINPYGAGEALDVYRESFVPSATLPAPQAMLTVSVICAETDERADYLASSLDLAWLRLQRGQFGPFPSPEEARALSYPVPVQAQIRAGRDKLTLGTPEAVRARLCAMASEWDVDEVMVTTLVHDHAARVRSYELLAEAMSLSRTPSRVL